MGGAARRIEQRFTWSDYQKWPSDERWEIVAGLAYDMSPAPSPRHQMIASRLHYRMEEFFIGRRCRVLQSPVDVRLSHEDVVQPDLIVVCNPKQIKATHIDGPPALAVEILSESSMTHDRIRKGALYARSGVREYWLVTPFPSMVEVLSLKRGAYVVHAVYGKEDVLASPVFTGLRVPLREVFEFALEPNERLRVVKESPGAYGYRKRRRA